MPTPRAVRDHRVPRRWRDGRGLPRDGLAARARRRRQGAPGRGGERRRAPRPLSPGGAAPGCSQPPERRRHLRARGGGRAAVPGARARPRRGPSRAPEARTASPRRGAGSRRAGRRGARGCARARDRPPRPQAGERQGYARGPGEGPRLRPRQGVGRRHGLRPRGGPLAVPDPRALGHGRRRHPGHRRLHVARAGAGTCGRQARRHLGLRRRPLRDADRPAPLRRRDGQRHAGLRAQDRSGVDGERCDASWGPRPTRRSPPGPPTARRSPSRRRATTAAA